jgi:hypothetical protein
MGPRVVIVVSISLTMARAKRTGFVQDDGEALNGATIWIKGTTLS